MIVPRMRLMALVAIVIVPASVAAVTAPGAEAPSLFVCAAVLAFAITDAAISLGLLRQVRVEGPPLVRMAKDREESLPLRIIHGDRSGTLLRLGLPLPESFESPQKDVWVRLPADSEASEARWTCTPRVRGRYSVSTCILECVSRFGLWDVRNSRALLSELRVYPNLQSERKNIAPLLIRRAAGLNLQRQVGQGREFEKLRDYLPGDPSDEIHWKASGKRGKLITKVFQVERTQEVYVILDSSRLTARLCAEPVTTVLERYVLGALTMALATEQNSDLFGLATFSDRIHGFVRARNGKEHIGAVREALLTLQPRLVTPDYDELCTFLRTRLRRRALLLFLTELDDPAQAESFLRNIRLLARQHLVVVNMARPEAARPLFSAEDVQSVDDVYQKLGDHLQWRRLQELGLQLSREGVRFSLLDPNRLTLELATQYLNIKQRQLL